MRLPENVNHFWLRNLEKSDALDGQAGYIDEFYLISDITVKIVNNTPSLKMKSSDCKSGANLSEHKI